MPITPPSPIQLDLSPANPSKLDAATLKVQLQNMGLDCSQLTDKNLSTYISEVESQLHDGAAQSFGITAPAGTVAEDTLPTELASAPRATELVAAASDAAVGSLAATMPPSEQAAVGNWTENDSAEGYSANLEVIQFPTHFAWLMSMSASNGFAGVVDNPPAYTGNYPNAAAIQNLFINVGVTTSSTVVKGIDKDTMTAVFSNAIQPLADASLTNYNQSGSRVIFLVENYDTTTHAADAIGFAAVDWNLQITDWKRKDKDGGDTHPTVLKVSARAATYSDVNLLCQHYSAVLRQFGIDPASAPSCRTQ